MLRLKISDLYQVTFYYDEYDTSINFTFTRLSHRKIRFFFLLNKSIIQYFFFANFCLHLVLTSAMMELLFSYTHSWHSSSTSWNVLLEHVWFVLSYLCISTTGFKHLALTPSGHHSGISTLGLCGSSHSGTRHLEQKHNFISGLWY